MSKDSGAPDALWWATEFELHTFYSYLFTLDTFLSKEIEVSRTKVNELQKDPDEFFDLNHYEYTLYQHELFTNLMLKTFIVGLCTFLESSLVRRCREVERKHNYPLSVKDLSGQGIQQAINYLRKVHQIEYPLENSIEWMRLQSVSKLRNCIVHNGGRLDESPRHVQEIKKYISTEPGVSLDADTNEIVLNREYCEKALRTVTKFLHAIDKATDKEIKTSLLQGKTRN